MLENEAIGYELLRLTASDRDTPAQSLRFELVDEASRGFVTLDARSGMIALARSLDYESQRNLSIRVAVVDSGEPPRRSEALVEVSEKWAPLASVKTSAVVG